MNEDKPTIDKVIESILKSDVPNKEKAIAVAAMRVFGAYTFEKAGGPFICGIGGESVMGCPDRLDVCPAVGADGFAVYKRIKDYDAPGW